MEFLNLKNLCTKMIHGKWWHPEVDALGRIHPFKWFKFLKIQLTENSLHTDCMINCKKLAVSPVCVCMYVHIPLNASLKITVYHYSITTKLFVPVAQIIVLLDGWLFKVFVSWITIQLILWQSYIFISDAVTNEDVKLLQCFVAVFGRDHVIKVEFIQLIDWRRTCL